MLRSPRDVPQRLSQLSPPSSARRSQPPSARGQSSQQQLHLLDLAFQGHSTAATTASLAYETFEPSPVLMQDESALMEAADPELFHAGVEEHARRLGMDPERERDFLWLARESLVAPLPDGWFHATASESGAPYYYSEHTGESRWDHPCDDQFRQIFRELKLQQQQQARRYDHYGGSAPTASAGREAPLNGGESHFRHHATEDASYYASAYQTLAWQDDSQQQHGGAGEAHVDHSEYHDSTVYAAYDTQQQQQQQQWGDDQAQVPANSSTDAYSEYSYDAAQTFQDQASEYDAESAPVALPQSSSARSRSSTSPRNNLADAQHTERLTQQYIAQKAADEQTICDLHVQVQTLSKQLEAQEEKHQSVLGDKDKLESRLGDYKERLDEYVKRCEELGEKNSTMKRELLAARNRLEEQQQKHEQDEAAATSDHSRDDEICRLTELVAKEQCGREEAERKREQLAKAQSRSSKELEDSRSQLAGLQAELAALQTAERQLDARASASAADASATAAVVAALTTQLGEKQAELSATKGSVDELEARIDELMAEHTRSTESHQAGLRRQLAEKDTEIASERQEADQLRSELQTSAESHARLERQLEEQKQLGAAQLGEAEDQNRALKRESRAFERDLKSLQTVSKEREEELAAAQRRVEALESKLTEQEKLTESARQAGFVEAERASAELVRQAQAEKTRVAELYAQELQARRKLHNRLMELQGNIRVFCRVRPIQPVEMKSEQAAPAIFFRENDHESLELLVGATENSGSGGAGDAAKGNFIGQKHSFEFDHIFQPASTQAQVFEQTRALVISALDGFNVCIFAYGQTGSGKTHTMEGTESDRGVNFRALQELFGIRDDRVTAGNFECAMKLSILEVYNETIVDLLDNSSGSSSMSGSHTPGGASAKGLDVRMGKTGVYVDNLIEVEVFNENDVVDLMKLGHSHRSVGSHDFNEHSSRSHLVLSIQIETVARTENRRRVSKLHLIDLAGSERVSKTAASGQRLKEAQNINRSLSALGDVIAALGASSKHVPYRNSKLTFLLQDSLSGNSKVLMFVNVSPVQWNAWETLCSLNFASRCRNVALGQAKQQNGTSSTSGGGVSTSSSGATSSASGAPSPAAAPHASGGPSSPAVRPMPRGAPPSSAIKRG